jgi:hypothetical protein
VAHKSKAKTHANKLGVRHNGTINDIAVLRYRRETPGVRFRFSIAGAGTAAASNALPQREYRNGPQHAGCYHTTVNAPAGEKTALAAVFMASCSGFKEVDFCEMNKFVAAISHDHLLLLDQTPSQFRR